MDILRVTALWTGFIGAPGYSNFFFAGGGGLISDAQQVADRVADAFDGLDSVLPEDVNVRVESEVARLDSDTGELIEYINIDQPSSTQGIDGGGYSAASGAVVNWRTNDVRFGRRIRGRTFIVPLGGGDYESDGSLLPATIGALNGFANTLRGVDLDSEFGVWSRPRDGEGGVFATVTGHNVPDMSAVLRSRRD